MIVVSLVAIVAAVVLSAGLLAVEVVRDVRIRRGVRRVLESAGSSSVSAPVSGRRPGIHWETPTVVSVRRDGGAVR